jgi:hypothetical protein
MLKRILIGAAVLALLGLGGIYLLDQTIFAAAPASSALPAAPTLDLAPSKRLDPTPPPAESEFTPGEDLIR